MNIRNIMNLPIQAAALDRYELEGKLQDHLELSIALIKPRSSCTIIQTACTTIYFIKKFPLWKIILIKLNIIINN